ncbi:hypothetical protein SKAU_G00148240 [Synaphobranchus kaupii]|uniref:Uncharacterized protein n=1 Tax=Synaphobranchus kaupii TaxID=118154 RepID=A0A9Q1FUP0_SYNKA|nr:hypothetical protein SKAU_G00148240 [Synaphobranchus kaupii]
MQSYPGIVTPCVLHLPHVLFIVYGGQFLYKLSSSLRKPLSACDHCQTACSPIQASSLVAFFSIVRMSSSSSMVARSVCFSLQ